MAVMTQPLSVVNAMVDIPVESGTPHAFLLTGTGTCRAEPAADAWRRMLTALAEELPG